MGFRDSLKNVTNSTIFLVRGLGLDVQALRKLGFINAFIDDGNHIPHYKHAVYLLFKPASMEDFQYFLTEEQLEKDSIILEEYDYEGGYVVMVYKFPEKWLAEYEKFLNGEFSMFKKAYVDLFPNHVETKNAFGVVSNKVTSIYHHIFNRSEELKSYWEDEIGIVLDEDMEYWSKPDLERETLDINKIKEDGQPVETQL